MGTMTLRTISSYMKNFPLEDMNLKDILRGLVI